MSGRTKKIIDFGTGNSEVSKECKIVQKLYTELVLHSPNSGVNEKLTKL
jgi:hypothetical protein